MAGKPEVLVVAGYYRPGYRAGGPIASVSNLVEALCDEFDFRVLAFDHDLGETSPYLLENRLPEAEYVSVGEARRAIQQHVREAKGVVYVQSLFSPEWGIFPIVLARRMPLLIAPRGQLAPGALAVGSAKKALALRMMRPLLARQNVFWQATAESDAREIRAVAPWIAPESLLVAPNLASDPGFTVRRKVAGPLRAVYVGRIDPKKNLLTAIRAVAKADVDLEVIGPEEDAGYAAECRREAGGRVTFVGALPPEAVREHLRAADAFLFPTYGENYGHSIVEAMMSGLPAVIGDTTPWRGLEARCAGFDLPPDDVDRFADALTKLAKMPEEEYARWSHGARASIDAATERSAAVEASRQMLRKVLDHARR